MTEVSSSGAILRRYVYGPGTDEPLVWYEGSGASSRRYLGADERGSITSVMNGGAGTMAIDTYDEYGIPSLTNAGRFQYTGQAWIPSLAMYDYKARIYSPTLGRFLQTDPTGYADGLNWYAYVANDPMNRADPTGLCTGSLISNNDGTCPQAGNVNPALNGAGTVTGPVQSGQGGRNGQANRGSNATGGQSGASTLSGYSPQNVAYSSTYGSTLGENPRFCSGGGRICTDLPGGAAAAGDTFQKVLAQLGGSASQVV